MSEQDKKVSKLEHRIEALENRIVELEGEVNATRGTIDSLDILQARILLLEEIFPKLAGELAFRNMDQ